VKYIRDPDFPCDWYTPRPPIPSDDTTCQSDGHYLCNECALRRRCYCGEPTDMWGNQCEKCTEVAYKIFFD